MFWETQTVEDERQRERMARGACYMLAQVRVQRAVNFKERNRPSPSGMYAERLGLHLEWDMYDKETTQLKRGEIGYTCSCITLVHYELN